MKKLNIIVLAALFFISGAAYGQQLNNVVLESRHGGKLLSFNVPSESNIVDYRVEGSDDNDHFEIIGKVKSIGNSVLPRSYQFALFSDFKYYRVAVVGMSGVLRYSECIVNPGGVKHPKRDVIAAEGPAVVERR